jgi:sec-independent protein translocase protein TatA
MGTFSIWHWVVVLVIVLVLFGGKGKLSSLMGDMAKGINAFKKGLKDPGKDEESQTTMKTIDGDGDAAPSETAVKKDETANS